MRLLFAVPHYYKAKSLPHGSGAALPMGRIQALTELILSLHQLFGSQQCEIDIARRTVIPVGNAAENRVDIVLCTTGGSHLIPQLPMQPGLFQHHETTAEPLMLGFECHQVLARHLGQYDFYCFLEDDIVIQDGLFFEKLRQFNQFTGAQDLLQPNRYEVSSQAPYVKAYVDGDIRPGATSAFQNIQEASLLQGQLLGLPVRFRRPLNPHAGCFFLNKAQMAYWTTQAHFGDRDIRFVSPLESAATLGIMKTFRIYKPDRACAGFLEVQHADRRFIQLIGNRVSMSAPTAPPVPVA